MRYHAALLYIHFEQFEIAFDVLNEFLRAGNDSPKVVQAFGLAILRMPYLETEIPADQRELVLIAGRAGIGMAARRPEAAQAAFDQLMARYSNAPNVHYAYGVFLLNQDSDAALKEFKRELEISLSISLQWCKWLSSILSVTTTTRPCRWPKEAVQLAPKMFPARNVLGRILPQLGQIDRAIKELEEGARLGADESANALRIGASLSSSWTRGRRKA